MYLTFILDYCWTRGMSYAAGISFSTVGVAPWNCLWRVARLCSHQRIPQQLHQRHHGRAGTEENRLHLERRHRAALSLRNRWEKHLRTLLLLRTSESAAASHLLTPPTGGTVLAAEVALQRGLACSTAGGTHHAFPSYGSGFCLLNDLAVAAKHVTSTSSRKVLVVDLDVHQVAGTSSCYSILQTPVCFLHSATIPISRMCLSGWWDCFYFSRGTVRVYFLGALWEKLSPPQTTEWPGYQPGRRAGRQGLPLHWHVNTQQSNKSAHIQKIN